MSGAHFLIAVPHPDMFASTFVWSLRPHVGLNVAAVCRQP